MRIIQSDKQIATLIQNEICKQLSGAISKSAKRFITKIRALFYAEMLKTDEYSSLTGSMQDCLRGHFGLTDAEGKVKAIISKWMEGIVYQVRKPTVKCNSINAGLRIYLLQQDYADVLALPQAYQETERKLDPSPLPWLRWLLLDGDKKKLIANYRIKWTRRGSRTGLAIMAGPDPGYEWSISTLPKNLTGTENNNWVTRLFTKITPLMNSIIHKEIKQELK